MGAPAVREVGEEADAARVVLVVVAHVIFDDKASGKGLSFDKRCAALDKR
jgi:hypothetical protein